jgi:hypothetical protein
MNYKSKKYKRYIIMSIIFIALGVTFSTTLKESVPSIGTIFIALGGLFLIIGMRMKRK